ncbi:MAG: L,D-transpeptidase [Candidatus Woesebacteria bacterium]
MSLKKAVACTVVAAAIVSVAWKKPAPLNFDNQIDPRTVTDSYDPQDRIGYINDVPFESPEDFLALDTTQTPPPTRVLGDNSLEKRIEVNLTTQTLTAFEGGAAVYEFPVSTGKWAPTPTGTFHIWSKFRFTKMSGGSKERHTYYYLPNVPNVMFFSNSEVAGARGFSIHGAYWHDNFGHPMSHGCVNMRVADSALIYNWADPSFPEAQRSGLSTQENPGTEIVIYGIAPKS